MVGVCARGRAHMMRQEAKEPFLQLAFARAQSSRRSTLIPSEGSVAHNLTSAH